MAQHTEGPWTNRHFNESGSIDVTSANYRTVSTWAPMVRVYPRLEWNEENGPHTSESAIEEAEANARLIASAPYLLTALKELELRVTQLLDGQLIGWPSALLPQVRGAIRLAEGDGE